MKVLMVCLGNICRSPLAEEIFREKTKELGIDVEVDSAGTANYHIGSAPDKRMIDTAKNRGYNISRLRARQLKPTDFEYFDFIFAMDSNNYLDILKLAKNVDQSAKVYQFQDFANVSEPDYVPDPYYGAQADFDYTFQVVENSAERIAKKIKGEKRND